VNAARARSLAALLLAGLLVAACAAPGVVAHVGGEPVTLRELEAYFAIHLLALEEPGPTGAELDRVKSRLLEALIEERLLLADARRRGVAVGDAEVEAYLRESADGEPGARAPDRDSRDLARQRLMVERLQERVAGEIPPPTDAEVRAYLEENRSRFVPDRRVRVRALRFDGEQAAEQVSRSIRDGRTDFERAVAEREDDPGQGATIELPWAGLPETLRSDLAGLQPGEISPPVDFEGHVYLLQVERWLEAAEEDGEEMLRLAREELETDRTREALETLARDLRRATRIEIHRDRLPFRYVPEG
jgi:parvulin-like peptidyl-prolyl isomerase